MPNTYGTIITNQGAAIIADCILTGKKFLVAEAAAGDGGGAYYQPTVDQTALINERWRGEIVAADISATTPNMIDVKVSIGEEVGNFTVRELGLFGEDGTLVAICNTPDTEKIAISDGVSGKLTMILHIVVADASVVEFVLNPSMDTVTMDDLEEAIEDHDADEEAHKDIREALTAHTSDATNPHDVTPAQIKAVPEERKVNGRALTDDITLTREDIGIEVDLSELEEKVEAALEQADNASDAAGRVQATADSALSTANNALPKTGGTLAGPAIAGGAQDLSVPQLRNIVASEVDLEDGVSPLPTGQIYIVYE